jgi:hypothetical protein
LINQTPPSDFSQNWKFRTGQRFPSSFQINSMKIFLHRKSGNGLLVETNFNGEVTKLTERVLLPVVLNTLVESGNWAKIV